jgi:predicted RNA-binding protein YlqC (UPF0109 family)
MPIPSRRWAFSLPGVYRYEGEPMLARLIENIAKAVVDEPCRVRVTESRSGSRRLAVLSVGRNDYGCVIRKRGKLPDASRTIIDAATKNSQERVILDIAER